MRLPLCLLLLVAWLACDTVAADHGAQAPLPIRYISIEDVPLMVEVADEAREREHGMMHRVTLPEGQGMLFVYPDEEQRVFWMRNTSVPLDAAFVSADGRIDEVVPLVPHSEEHVRSRRHARFVLEVPRGWFDRHGLGPGSRIDGLPGE
jgi:uncharacterized membrane protein (UPF0127 family)